jgi:hypothetical protein
MIRKVLKKEISSQMKKAWGIQEKLEGKILIAEIVATSGTDLNRGFDDCSSLDLELKFWLKRGIKSGLR